MAARRREVKLATLLGLCSFLLCARQLHGAANIDTVQPIVRASPDTTVEDDYGYAVVLHQVRVPTEGNFEDALSNTRIIVGAPKGTYPGGIPSLPAGSPVSMTGLVYTCPVNQGTCSGLMGNPSNPNDLRMFDGEADGNITTITSGGVPIEEPEYKSGQLMGATLESSGSHFLVCAPRYQTNGTFRLLDNRRPVGRCLISGQELTNFVDYRPCRGGNRVVDVVGDNQCLTGIGATLYVDQNNRTLAALGAVGDRQYDGTIYLYDVTNGNNTVVQSSTSPVASAAYLYEGYSVTSGSITGSTTPDFVVGVPRYDGSLYTGSVFVRNQDSFADIQTNYNLTGETIGEYYGWSVATADLNNDGFDEILVGAPVYSLQNKAEVGRVYVYKNNGDGTVDSPIRLNGQGANARFGTSIVNLGDVNGDNFDDVAIGAPYYKGASDSDSSGAVYIYYGNFDGQIISTTPNQIINASSVMNRVDGLDELKSFGFSLSSGVDVDNNAYNDLLVGAYESKTAVLFRTLSIAHVTVNASIIGGDTILLTGKATDFTLSVCARYNGRGLDRRPLETNLIVREVGTFNRLTFSGKREYNGSFSFITTDNENCVMVIVSIKPLSEQSANVNVAAPYEVIADFKQFERPLTPTDGNEVLDDLRDVPLLVLNGDTTARVTPIISCANGPSLTRCDSDIQITFDGIEYRASISGMPLLNRDSVVAGQVQFVDLRLNYSNIGVDPAFGTELEFTIPEHFARQASVMFGDQVNNIVCNSVGRNYTCDLDNFLPSGEPSKVVVVRLTVDQNTPIIGNENSVTFSASIRVDPNSTDDSNEANNAIDPVTINFSAIADLFVKSVSLTRLVDYGTTTSGDENSVSNLGRRVILEVSVTNNGSSTDPFAELTISFPVGTSSVGPHFYVFHIRVPDSTVVCSSDNFIVNRDNLTFTSTSSRRRRAAQLSKRQEAQTQAVQTNVNCSDSVTRATGSCANVVCNITDFTAKQVTVDVLAVVDRRFFDSQTEIFTYTSYASIHTLTDFVNDPDPQNNNRQSEYSLGPRMDDGGGFPIWIPIVCAIAAVILIIILFVLLYFFGFFRRKRVNKEEAEGDFEVREVPPEGQGAAGAGGAVLAPIPGAVLAPIPEKGDDIGEEIAPEKQDLHNEIGDASDLHDGEITDANKEPEETSL